MSQSKSQLKIRLNDGTTRYSTSLSKRKFDSILTGLDEINANYVGTCRVTYDDDLWNEFDFSSREELTRKGYPCLEKKLIDELQQG